MVWPFGGKKKEPEKPRKSGMQDMIDRSPSMRMLRQLQDEEERRPAPKKRGKQ